MDNVTDGIITISDRGSIESVNSAAQHIFGYSAGQLIGKDVGTLVPELDRAHQESYVHTGQSKALGVGAREVVGRHKDGNSIPLELAVSEMWFSGEQKFVGVAHDTTARKAVEQRLRQAEKMEATGQFTGGIAHDFNNLLTVIMGNAETLTKALVGNPRLMSVANQLSIAAQRGADLTRSLLAFSRKLVLQPAVTDVDQLVSRMDELLRRTLGEHIHIKIVTCSELWFAIVDPAHLEAAILNLAVNGRDAMPQGGELTIATSNAELDRSEHDEGLGVGSYVMISVTDTGGGMTPEVAGRAFEPFFTTKEVGKGTGLGLSMVYGFVKQSNGHIKIDSEAGRGTTVRLYLPRSRQADEPSIAPSGGPESVGGAETILVVEDDPMVHTYVTRQIQSLGYRVLSARSGVAALDVLRQAEPIDLLFTDVVMPGGMDGPELVVEARRLRPDLRVLYTSGYTENSGMRRRRLGPGDELLSKPYRRDDLAARLRKVLDHAADEGR
jgi:PAS domain S-box-containing protein